MDLVVRTPHLPVPGETVLGSAYRTYPGGKGANQAVAAARMGAAVSLVGAIGDDPHGTKLRQTLEPEGLNLTHLSTRAGESTGLGMITVAEGGENTIVVSSGANALVSPDDIEAARPAIAGADVLLLQLELPMASIATAIRIAKESSRQVVLNAAPARTLAPDLVRQVDVLIVNRSEAARLLSLDPGCDPARLSLRLPELGPATVVLTLGANGAMLTHRGRPLRYPAANVRAVDATGAGDAFCGAFAAMWPTVAAAGARSNEEQRLIARCLGVASAAGALATTRAGAIPSLPRLDDVRALAEKMEETAGIRH